MSILALFDHTNVKATANQTDINVLCQEAIAYGFFSVCVNSCFVAYAKQQLQNTSVQICATVGFPLGACALRVKVFETQVALKDGCDEIDMVLNLGALKKQDEAFLLEEIRIIKAQCLTKKLKVIVETAFLTEKEKVFAAQLVQKSPADFLKTSTGFAHSGAKVADIALFRKILSPNKGIKAAGGIDSGALVLALLKKGANRIGSSKSVLLAKELGYEPKTN